MNTFFDLREFLIAILKKIRLFFILTVICIIGGISIRFVPLAQEYINFDKITTEELTNISTDYPYLYQARRTLYIEPIYETIGNETIDISNNIISTYLACYQNKNILEPLVDKYYKEATLLVNSNQDAQLRYQFMNGADRKPFELTNFYQMMEIRNVNNRLISLYVKSPDSDFSERLVSDFEELVSAQVRELAGDYSYSITEGQVGITLPEDKTGVVISPTTGKTIREKPSISYIAKRCIKGGIWGAGLGIAISLLWSFFYFSVSQIIYEEDDLKEFSLPIIATLVDSEKKRVYLQDKLIAFLRGNKTSFCTYAECSAVVCEMIRQNGSIKTNRIGVTGSCDNAFILKLSDALNRTSEDIQFIPAGNLVYSADAIQKLKDIDCVLLVEKLNDSSKTEIEHELENMKYLNKMAVGFVVVR